VFEFLERAEQGALPESKAALLRGIRFHAEHRLNLALDSFEDALKTFGASRDLLYCLFETAYHLGRPHEALAYHEKLSQMAPGFALGLAHVYGLSLIERDLELFERAEASNTAKTDALWTLMMDMALGKYDKVLVESGRLVPGRRSTSEFLAAVAVHLVRGDPDRAEEALGGLDEGYTTFARWGIALARGDERGIAQHQKNVIAGLERVETSRERTTRNHSAGLIIYRTGDARGATFNALLLAYLARPNRDLRRTLLARLDSVAPPDGEEFRYRTLRALAGGILDAPELLPDRTLSRFPDGRAVERAFNARQRNDGQEEIRSWKTSISLETDGRFLVTKHYLLARAEREAGNQVGVIEACREVIQPRIFSDWGWNAVSGICLRWSAEAALALGRKAESEEYFARLLSERSRAPATDPLLRGLGGPGRELPSR
jgi:hypothetical protein